MLLCNAQHPGLVGEARPPGYDVADMSAPGPTPNRYEVLFARHRTPAIPELWPWQREVLAAFEPVTGDVAIELPTGTGETLLGLLAGEEFRQSGAGPVAYLAGNKQLAQQVEREARDLNFPVVRFQGPKASWEARGVRNFNWGRAIGVMNYWNYFNARPGVELAGMLILDDVHLLEGPLRDFFTVAIGRGEALYDALLGRIVARCPYYTIADDLLNDVDAPRPPEMLVFPDSAELADEVRALVDAQLADPDDPNWWAWRQIRDHLQVCCRLLSRRAVTFTPYIPPSQTIEHFSEPARRLYLSATVGSTDDLQRRLGTPPLTKLSASVQPRQGERYVAMRGEVEPLQGAALVAAIWPLLARYPNPKALWLCARGDTADGLETALQQARLPGQVWRLVADNAVDEPFAAAPAGHLVTAGRYDGMDFPDEACRVEVVPEVPVATSDLEEFVSAYLRDAPFSEQRFAQRVAQALGRCNRSQDDRAVYLLTDPEFVSRFSQRRAIAALPDDVAADIAAALDRADRSFKVTLGEAIDFLAGHSFEVLQEPPGPAGEAPPMTAGDEVNAFLALWREDYGRAALLCDRVAVGLAASRGHRAFSFAMRALALQLAARYGDAAAAVESRHALRTAASVGAASSFFTRLRLADTRLGGRPVSGSTANYDELFAAWDRLITRYGAAGPRFERWTSELLAELRSDDHDTIARAIARVGSELLGLAAAAPKATGGEPDAHWELAAPRRLLAFEIKLAPGTHRIGNDDIEQAEGAVRALEAQRSRGARGLLVTPHHEVGQTALDRLERVRLIEQAVLAEEVERLIMGLREYRRGWVDDAGMRAERRAAVEPELPRLDWLWSAFERSPAWVDGDALRWRALPGPPARAEFVLSTEVAVVQASSRPLPRGRTRPKASGVNVSIMGRDPQRRSPKHVSMLRTPPLAATSGRGEHAQAEDRTVNHR
jgi:hypothetical protein